MSSAGTGVLRRRSLRDAPGRLSRRRPQASADAQRFRRGFDRSRHAQSRRPRHLRRPRRVDPLRRFQESASGAVHRDRRLRAVARGDGRRARVGRKDSVDRELRDVQSGSLVGTSAHDHGAQRDQREDRGRARGRLGRPRRRHASGDRRHRHHARDSTHDGRRAVRRGANEKGDDRAIGALGPGLPAFRTREIGGRHERTNAVRSRRSADVSRRRRRRNRRVRHSRLQRADRGRPNSLAKTESSAASSTTTRSNRWTKPRSSTRRARAAPS